MINQRRNFLKNISLLGLTGTTYTLLSACSSHQTPAYSEIKITKIELYKYDINIPRYFSLVGPACSAWQQIAIGAGAEWVEAIEKKEDSKSYLDCVLHSATKKQANGYYTLNPTPSFDLVLDEKRLKKVCSLYIRVDD